MNVLIIGYGNVGKHYIEILNKINNIKKIYLLDIIKHQNVKNCVQINFKDILKKNIKHAIICTPSNLHFDYAKYLIKNNINTLIEKPFVLSISHAKKISSLTKKK